MSFLSRALGICLAMMLITFATIPAYAQTCTDAQKTSCAAFTSAFNSACASSLPSESTSPKRWLKRIQAFPAAYNDLLRQRDAINACVTCGFVYAKWEPTCKRQRDNIASSWASYIEGAAKPSLQFQSYIKSATKRRQYSQILSSFDSRLTELKGLLTVSTELKLSADMSGVQGRITELQTQRASFQELHDKELASVKCPKKGKKNKRHLKTARAFFKKDPKFAKDVRSLRVTGRASKKYVRHTRTTFETLPLVACIQDPKPERGPRCYVWDLSVQRSKVKGGKWTPWDTVLVGAQKEMLCRNLK